MGRSGVDGIGTEWIGKERLKRTGRDRRGAEWIGTEWNGKEQIMRYQFEGSHRPTSVGINAVVAELERIRNRDGGIRPAAVVEESRPEDAPLHHEFEWDDSAAAEQYRIAQARQIIRAIVLVPQPEMKETFPTIRAFLSIHDSQGGIPQARVYQPTFEVLESAAASEEVRARFARELRNLQNRYRDFLEANAEVKARLQQFLEATA